MGWCPTEVIREALWREGHLKDGPFSSGGVGQQPGGPLAPCEPGVGIWEKGWW